MEWDIPDDSVNVESTVLEPIAVSKFLDTLSETDRKILTMRMDDVTLEKIAEELGFKAPKISGKPPIFPVASRNRLYKQHQ